MILSVVVLVAGGEFPGTADGAPSAPQGCLPASERTGAVTVARAMAAVQGAGRFGLAVAPA
jgi:hypothetical protein